MPRSVGSEGVACLESELDIFVLQCVFIILELVFLKPQLSALGNFHL